MANAAGLLVLAGAGYYAHSQGWLDQPLAALRDALEVGQGDETPPEPEPAHPVPDPTPASAPVAPSPGVSWEEAQLLANSDLLSAWSAANLELTAALFYHESAHSQNPRIRGPVVVGGANDGHRAHGIAQVMPRTAEWMHSDLNYTRMAPTRENLLTIRGSVYFGTGYLQWLATTYRQTPQWIIHAYSGGPGWVNLRPGSRAYRENQGHSRAVWARYNQLIARAA